MTTDFQWQWPTNGTDPELFIRDDDHKIIPAEELITEDCNDKDLRVDNAAIELDVHPAGCLQTLSLKVSAKLWSLDAFLRSYKGINLSDRILLSPSAELRRMSDLELPSIREFGCNPSFSFNGENVTVNVPRIHPLETLVRSIGYHIHLGWLDAGSPRPDFLFDLDGHVRLVQMCDLFVGIPGVILERDQTEKVLGRRQLLGYGRAGEFRRQPHGFEYRTLGPWPLISPAWNGWAHAAVRDAFNAVFNNFDEEILKHFSMKEVGEIINNNNVNGAVKIWNTLGKVLSGLMDANRFYANSAINAHSSVNSPVLSKYLRRLFNMFVKENHLPFGLKSGFSMNNWIVPNSGFLNGFGSSVDAMYPSATIMGNDQYDSI